MHVALVYFYLWGIAFFSLGGTPIQVRMLFALGGLVFAVIQKQIKLLWLFLINLPIVLYSFFITLWHSQSDFSLATVTIKSYSYTLAAYFIICIINNKAKFNTKMLLCYLSKLFYHAVMIQISLGLVIFFIPGVKNFFDSFIVAVNAERINDLSAKRIVLIGETNFFGAGIILAFAILIWFFLVDLKYWKLNCYRIVSLMYLTLIGMMVSRTTFIGLILGIIYLLLNKNAKFLFGLTIKAIPLIFIVGVFFLTIIPEHLLRFGFEHFFNAAEQGEFSSESTDELFRMWTVVPKSISTLFLGDGLWISDSGYYMETDVGYLRLIFYWGILGSTLFFILQIIQYVYVKKNCNVLEIKNLLFICILSTFIFNLKGFVTIQTGGLFAIIVVILFRTQTLCLSQNNFLKNR